MKNKPALVTPTKLNHEGSLDAKVVKKLKVTYVFEIFSRKDLNLPYAISINGAVPARFNESASKLSCAKGKIEIYVSSGERVALFLNSDAHPSYRKNPVYSVTPNDCDVLIKIIEKAGKNSETDDPKESEDITIDNTKTKIYNALLTGDIWMKISHKYTKTEVDSIISSNFSPSIVENVKKIYDNLRQPVINVVVPSKDLHEQHILISFSDSDNARNNIHKNYDFLTEGLTRAHPAGYAAILSAAIATGIKKVKMSSTWRPMMGSIAHRAGLGLDVEFVGSTQLNRQELRGSSKNTENVSEEEKRLFSSFESAKKKQSAAHKEVSKVRKELQKASSTSSSIIEAKRQLNESTKAAAEADKVRKTAESSWIAERDRNEPDEVRRFRHALITSPCVSQLFDPWVMDLNTLDNNPAESNTQTDKNETLHAHHLHITIREPKII